MKCEHCDSQDHTTKGHKAAQRAAWFRKYLKERREAWEKEGKCTRCGGGPLSTKKRCGDCRSYVNDWWVSGGVRGVRGG